MDRSLAQMLAIERSWRATNTRNSSVGDRVRAFHASNISMPREVEPEIIPPGSPRTRDSRTLDDATLNWLASWLDDIFQIPGTSIRFGLDPIIGVVPGLGDLLTGAASFLIIFSAWQRQLPRVTVARMVVNVAIDTFVGAIPLFGDAFDLAWKSNRKNVNLLQRTSLNPTRRQDWRDWLFLLGVVLAMIALIAIPVLALWFVIHLLRR